MTVVFEVVASWFCWILLISLCHSGFESAMIRWLNFRLNYDSAIHHSSSAVPFPDFNRYYMLSQLRKVSVIFSLHTFIVFSQTGGVLTKVLSAEII